MLTLLLLTLITTNILYRCESSSLNFTTVPQDVYTYNSFHARFTCQAIGATSYIWYKNGKIPTVKRWNASENTLLYKFVKLPKDNGSLITCEASNGIGSVRRSANLFIYAKENATHPIITVGPRDAITDALGSVSFNCTSFGILGDIRWKLNGITLITLPWLREISTIYDGLYNTSILTLYHLTAEDNGVYVCEAFGTERVNKGFDYRNATLTVIQAPEIVEYPEDFTQITEGNSLHLECLFIGYPIPKIYWVDAFRNVVNEGPIWEVEIVSFGLEGAYRCMANNSEGSDQSNTFNLIVHYAPKIFLSTQAASMTIPVGEKLVLFCNATGRPPPTIFWFKDNIILTATDHIQIQYNNLTIERVELSDKGIYTCLVVNLVGNDTSSTAVRITTPPLKPIGLKVVNILHDKATLQWSPVEYENPVLSYDLVFWDSNRSILYPNLSISALLPVNDLLEYYLDFLTPYTSHIILIQAWNDIGKSGFSQFPQFKTKTWIPGPPTFSSRNITPFSVDIFLTINENTLNGPLIGVNFTVSSLLDKQFSNTTVLRSSSFYISHTENNLDPFHLYSITAYTYNGDYYSNSSVGYVYTSESSPNSPPTNLDVSCTSPSSCILEWDPPIHANGIITSYTLTIENLNISQSHVGSFSVKNEFYIADDLNPYSLYSWKILASTYVGAGPTIIYKFNTPQGVPNTSPSLDIHTINSTTIALSWASLDKGDLNGIFKKYQIMYTFTGVSDEVITETYITEDNSLTLTNLTPYTNYGFSIRVNAGIGYGPYSPIPLYRITTPDVPIAIVENITADSHSPNSILLQWEQVPTALIYSPAASYRIEMKTGTQWVNIQELIYMSSRYLVTGLLPNMVYTFRVQLFNERGFAPFSDEINITTLQTIPGVPLLTGFIGEDPLHINISITPTNSTTGDIIQYIITVHPLWDGTIETDAISPSSTHDTTYFRYNATRYISFYKFIIFAKTNAGDGESAILLIETGGAVPSQPPIGLLALPQSSTSIYLSWEEIPTQFLNGHLTGYQIRYRSIFQSEWDYLNVTQTEYKHVTGLNIFTIYLFQVAGVTIGPGEFSITSSKRTLPDRPSVVKIFHVERAESNLLEIEWDLPDHPNGNISGYRVQVIEVRTNSFILYSVIQNKMTLTNLEPYTRYKISIAAINQILTGKFSTLFEVMTAEDTPSKPYFSHVIRRSRQLTVYWHSPQDPNGVILDYNLTCIPRNYETVKNEKITVIHEVSRYLYSADCTGLSPNRIYELELSARNSFDSSKNLMYTQTDFAPPILSNISSSPQPVADNSNLFTLPLFSETVGTISFYLVVVIVFLPITTNAEDLTTNYSLAELQVFSPVFDTSKPYPYIAANFTPKEYSEFEIGDEKVYGGFENVAMKNGYGYALYVLACVESINANRYLVTSSSLSQPIIPNKETPSKYSLAVITSIVSASTVFLCILICLLLILVCVFCARIRSKKLISERNIPYRPCDMELSTVPWSANVNFKKIPKGSDPITYYRNVVNDPQLEARPPVPAYMLPKILENLVENGEQRLSEEYSHLTPIDTSTTNTATLEINAKRNRYLNILPYDHNRVTLNKTDSDYINASFIDSADKRKAYIATQGPTELTLEDFWQMVYEQHVQCIVMITKLKEKGVEKCIQYWPTDGTNYFGKLKVTLNSTSFYCDYTIRELTISKLNSKESRIVHHFQFISWPDHRVPSHALPMLNLIKRVHLTLRAKHINTQQPLLVHCSAGVGRTGTFIVLDSMMKRMLHGREIDVFGHVSYLRTQRMFMVQGEDQYLFIFKVLAECFTSQKTSIHITELENFYSNLSMVIPATQITGFDSEFLNLEIDYDEDSFTAATSAINQPKNRHAHFIPLEISRVILPILNEQFGSDYVNASFIDGYTHKQQFIATQTPLGETITDFWRMIWHYNSNIIVMLNQYNELDNCYYPEKIQMYDRYQVEKISERSNKDYTYQQFSMMNLNSGEMRNISHFQTNDLIPAKTLLLLCQEIGNMYQSLLPNGTGPITVNCVNGSGNTGMLIAAINLLEELRESENLNIFQTVHYLRLQRPYMVESVEQYQIVYEAILQQAKIQRDINRSRIKNSDEATPPTSPVKMSTFAKVSIGSWSSFQNRLSYTNTYRSSQISASSAFSNPDEVLEISY